MIRRADTSIGGRDGAFPSTLWSEVLTAGDAGAPDRRKRLEDLCRRYWRPVYAYIRVAWRKPVEDAKDLAQAFFARLLERDRLAGVRPERGSFRGFLLRSLRNFLIDAQRGESARRRNLPTLPLPAAEAEPAALARAVDSGDAERAYYREWLRSLLADSIAELQETLAGRGRGDAFEAFRLYCLEQSARTYGDLGSALGRSESEVRHGLELARGRLRAIVRRRILEGAADVAETAAYLCQLLGE